jgi:hypothetical protein
MPILDSCHWQVVRALEKDGWQVNPKPSQFTEENSGMTVIIDLYAERSEDERLFVEVKCYPEKNRTQELYVSFGQYMLYRSFLQQEGLDIPLYLAVPKEIYATRFHNIIRQAIEDNDIKVVVVDIETETVSEWIE